MQSIQNYILEKFNDAKNGDEQFMYGICSIMECLAYMIDEKYGDDFSHEFIENMLTSEEKADII